MFTEKLTIYKFHGNKEVTLARLFYKFLHETVRYKYHWATQNHLLLKLLVDGEWIRRLAC